MHLVSRLNECSLVSVGALAFRQKIASDGPLRVHAQDGRDGRPSDHGHLRRWFATFRIVFAAVIGLAPVAVGHRVVPRAAFTEVGRAAGGVVGGAVGLRELFVFFGYSSYK